MATNDAKINGENDLLELDDSYQSANPATAHGVGGTTTASETFDRVGSAASEFNDPGALSSRADGELNQLDAEMDKDSPLKWVIPLVILALLIIVGYAFCGKS